MANKIRYIISTYKAAYIQSRICDRGLPDFASEHFGVKYHEDDNYIFYIDKKVSLYQIMSQAKHISCMGLASSQK